jgi:uroporphyrinogen-III synthase
MKVFISKPLCDLESLIAFCTLQQWTLQAQSLIELHYNPDFKNSTSFDGICFGSKKAVTFYLSKHSIPKGKWIACVGSQTSSELIKAGYQPNFIGEKSGDPKQVALALRSFAGNTSCFFPVSNLSLGTLHEHFSDDQKGIQILYTTNLSPIHVGASDIYVFSSPSNVQSFLEVNAVPKNAVFIAWGQSTAEKMRTSDMEPKFILHDSQTQELLEILSDLNVLK